MKAGDQKIINLARETCINGCPENGWNFRLIKKYYHLLIEASEGLIRANRNVDNIYPLDDIRIAAKRINKAEQKLINELEEIGWENNL